MPNWCDTTYRVVGDKTEVESLYELLKEDMKTDNWIYNIVSKHIGTEKADKMYLRGEILDLYLDDEQLVINQETAWCEQEGFREWIEDTYPNVKVYYIEEEPGCEVYYTNDSERQYFSDRFLIDGYDVHEYFETIEQVAEWGSKHLGYEIEPTVDAVNDAFEKYMEEKDDEDDYLYLHVFEIAD